MMAVSCEALVGLLNVNAVCLQFPKVVGHPNTEVGKGVYPIFAIMSHECVCNARYVVDPATFNMYVRARTNIKVRSYASIKVRGRVNIKVRARATIKVRTRANIKLWEKANIKY
jgi:hypothetical protein